MSAEILLNRLDRVRAAGAGRWMAACPAHEDKSPSLSIRALDDGRTLAHCFGGCSAADVLVAVGLSLGDLFPAPLKQNGSKPIRPGHWHMANVALRKIKFEVLLVAIAAENIAAGLALSAEDRERVIEAAGKIRAAAEVVG